MPWHKTSSGKTGSPRSFTDKTTKKLQACLTDNRETSLKSYFFFPLPENDFPHLRYRERIAFAHHHVQPMRQS